MSRDPGVGHRITTELRVPAASPWRTTPLIGTVVRRLTRAPYTVLALSFLLTVAATAFVAIAVRARDEARLLNAVQFARDRITARMDTYIAMLHGASGLFAASGEVTRSEFRRYVEQLDVRTEYPGIRGIGYAAVIPSGASDSVIARARADGLTDFRLWRDQEEDPWIDASTGIVYLEPLDVPNAAAIGFDMLSNPVRRAAMLRARDSARPAMSGPVRLVQEIDPTSRQPGFLVYFPVYRRGEPPTSVEERRAALTGFVYSPFRAGDLFRGIFADSLSRRLSFRVYDGAHYGPPEASYLLYDATADPAVGGRAFAESDGRRTVIEIAGRPWTLVVASMDLYGSRQWPWLAALIAGIGTLVSYALFAMTRAQVRARTTAEESEYARARFFAAMSHELRTPLNAIVGYNDLLLAGVYGPLTLPQEQGIDRSQKAARHLVELVNDVLEVSKIEAGKADIALESVALITLIEDLFVTIRPLAESWGCELRLEACACAGNVRTDPRRVRQILLNLLSNATKFGSGRPVTVRCLTHGEMAWVEVIDAGPGISPENLRRIFDEFVQLPSATAGGTGLGLAISRRLARLLGGRLEVESVIGHGSTFRLVIPLDQPTVESALESALAGRS